MSVYILPQQSLPAPELIETMTGSNVLIGELLYAPVKLIFDNQSTVSVVISLDAGDGLVQWKTFTAGEALVLDGDLYIFPKGTKIYGNGALGDFSVSYTYIKYP